MNRDQILRRNDEITAETDAVIRRGKEIVVQIGERRNKTGGSAGKGGAPAAYRATEDRQRI